MNLNAFKASDWDTWIPADNMPDDETTVLLGFADGDTELGYAKGGIWRSAEGLVYATDPVCWTHTPAVPERFIPAT